MERSRRDVFRSRTASMVARILAWLGFEDELCAIRRAYALAPTRRLAVSRASDAIGCGSGAPRRRVDIATAASGRGRAQRTGSGWPSCRGEWS
jgi:hypothetical protein